MNKVVNFKKYGSVEQLNKVFGDKWMYVGRQNMNLGLRGSDLANPFSSKKYANAKYVETKEEAISEYRKWLWSEMQNKYGKVMRSLEQIEEDTVLVCWCAPSGCHAEVIAKAARWMREQKEGGGGEKELPEPNGVAPAKPDPTRKIWKVGKVKQPKRKHRVVLAGVEFKK